MAIDPLCTPDLTVKANSAEGLASPIRCKRWSCPCCAERNRRRVIAIAVAAKPRAMLTLTVSSKLYPDPDDAAEALKRGLRLLRLRLSRHAKLTNFQFLAVFEKHKSGHPHLHLLVRGQFIPWKVLRSWWEELTGSTHVDIRAIKTIGKAAFYVAKYIGKDLAAFAHCKRWWRSHGYSEDVADDYQPDYTIGRPTRYRADIHKLYFALKFEGWEVKWDSNQELRWRNPRGSPFGIADILAFSEGRTTSAVLRTARGRT